MGAWPAIATGTRTAGPATRGPALGPAAGRGGRSRAGSRPSRSDTARLSQDRSTLPRVRSFEASTRIDASADTVWEVLSDVGGWRDWDSGVDRVEGRVALGERLI